MKIACPTTLGSDPCAGISIESHPRTPSGSCRATRRAGLFGVEIECCARCGAELKIIASIEEPQLIANILSQLELTQHAIVRVGVDA